MLVLVILALAIFRLFQTLLSRVDALLLLLLPLAVISQQFLAVNTTAAAVEQTYCVKLQTEASTYFKSGKKLPEPWLSVKVA